MNPVVDPVLHSVSLRLERCPGQSGQRPEISSLTCPGHHPVIHLDHWLTSFRPWSTNRQYVFDRLGPRNDRDTSQNKEKDFCYSHADTASTRRRQSDPIKQSHDALQWTAKLGKSREKYHTGDPWSLARRKRDLHVHSPGKTIHKVPFTPSSSIVFFGDFALARRSYHGLWLAIAPPAPTVHWREAAVRQLPFSDTFS